MEALYLYCSPHICKWIERSIFTKECYAELAWRTIQLYRRQQDIIKERVSRESAPLSSRPAPLKIYRQPPDTNYGQLYVLLLKSPRCDDEGSIGKWAHP
jgi:hypothetical protein